MYQVLSDLNKVDSFYSSLSDADQNAPPSYAFYKVSKKPASYRVQLFVYFNTRIHISNIFHLRKVVWFPM